MMNRRCSKIFLVTSLLLTIPLAAMGCSKETTDSGKDDPTSVKVSTVNISSIQTDVEYGSKLASLTEIAVISKVAGKIDNVNVEVGSYVKKGDVLAVIDSKELQAQYNQAKGAYDTANAKNTLNRIQKEYNIGDASKEELNAAKLRVDSLTTQLKSAEESLELLQSKSGPQANAAAAAQVSQAQGALDLLGIQISDTVITAPVDGVVSAKNVDIGKTVSGGTVTFVIIDNSSLTAEVNMTDKSVVKVVKGQKIPVKLNTFEDKVFEGVVDSISPAADIRTQLYSVKVKVDNKDNSIKAGMIARLSFPNERKKNILVVPKEAVFTQNSVSYVYTVVDNKVKRAEVETGVSSSSEIEIKSGVKQGDYVIIEGQSFLQDEQKVTLVKN